MPIITTVISYIFFFVLGIITGMTITIHAFTHSKAKREDIKDKYKSTWEKFLDE
jgi:MFS superfamily sulfate permease-like transporter